MLAASSDRRSTAVCMPGNRQMRGGGNAGEIVRGGVAKRGVLRPKSFVSTLGGVAGFLSSSVSGWGSCRSLAAGRTEVGVREPIAKVLGSLTLPAVSPLSVYF